MQVTITNNSEILTFIYIINTFRKLSITQRSVLIQQILMKF